MHRTVLKRILRVSGPYPPRCECRVFWFLHKREKIESVHLLFTEQYWRSMGESGGGGVDGGNGWH
jgi:hypothetical protein